MNTSKLKLVVENAAELSRTDQRAFAMIRRSGFGASDSSVILGVNPFDNIEKLLANKRSLEPTADELAIGQMVNVRKGADLEPLIMKKFIDRYGFELEKPEGMYNIIGTKLNVNFDGVMVRAGFEIPVECKFISAYGGKYYDFNKAMPKETLPLGADQIYFGGELQDHIQAQALRCGIPAYYYTQIQQQLLALDAEFGYLAALNDKDWELYTFKISADKYCQEELVRLSNQYWEMI